MSQPNLENQLQAMTPAQPGPQVRAQVVAAAEAAAPTAGAARPAAAGVAAAASRSAVTPPRVLPLRRVFSIAAMIMCAAAVGLMAWFANRGERVEVPTSAGRTQLVKPHDAGTPVPAKHLPTTIDILNAAPARTAPVDPRYEVAKAPAFCRVVELKGLVTGHDQQAAAGRWQVLSADDTLNAGASLRVAGDGLSYAVIGLQDGSEILVGSGSELTLRSLRDIQLNGGRALVRVSPGAAFQLVTSQHETIAVGPGQATASKTGAPASLASFQITDRVFAMGSTDTYIPRWKRGDLRDRSAAVQAGEERPLPPTANLAVLQGAVTLAGQSATRKTVDAGARVNLLNGDWNVEHDMSGIGADCAWIAGCSGVADRGVGQLTISAADAAALSPIEIGRVQVTVEVRDQIALTVIDEYFVNKNDRQLEGKFFFPLPADASISGFAMWIDDRKVQGEIVERERAREIYEQILREKRDPGLLEWAGGNEFQARVFPIPPKGEKHIRISYTQVLPFKGGRVHYSYPLMSEMLKKNPLANLEVNLNIHEDAITSDLRSESHSAAAREQSLAFTAKDYAPAQDFTASWIPGGHMPELKVFPTVRADEGGFYMAMVTPYTDADGKPMQPVAEQSPAPRRWLFVVDASGSVTTETWALTRATLESICATCGGEDTFNVILFDRDAKLLYPDYQPATGVNFDSLSKQLSKVDPFGASDLEKAFTLAAEQAGRPAPEGMGTTVVYLGDGVPSAGEQRTARLIAEVGQKFSALKNCNGFAVGIGGSCDSSVIDGLGRQLRGLGLQVEGLNNIAAAVGQLTDSTTGGGLLTDLAVTVDGVQVADQYPTVLPNLRLGDQLILAARYSGSGASTVTVKGLLNGKAWSKTFSTQFPEGETAGANPFVPRLWAKRHITYLLNQMDLEIGDPAVQKAAIIDASKKYTLITPFTSFLVLESEDDYRRFNVEHNFNMDDFGGGDATKEKNGKVESALKEAEVEGMEMAAAPAMEAPAEMEKDADKRSDSPASPKPMATTSQMAKKSAPEKLERQQNAQGAARELSKSQEQLEKADRAEPQADMKSLYDDEYDSGMDGKVMQAGRKQNEERKRKAPGEIIESVHSLDELEPMVANRLAESDGETRYDRFNARDEQKELKGIGAGSGGGSYGYRSGGGRRRAVLRAGGSRADESIFPEDPASRNTALYFLALNGATEETISPPTTPATGGLWTGLNPTTAPQSLGDYTLMQTQLPQAISAAAQPTVKQICGRLAELACQLAPVDAATGKPGEATEKIVIRADAVEHAWLDDSAAKLTSDGRFTLLTRADATPIKRKAQPGDRFLVLPNAPAFLGYSYAELEAAYDISVAGAKDGITTLLLVERNLGGGEQLRVQVDSQGNVLRIDRYQGDTLTGSTVFTGYHAVAGAVEAPTTRTDLDAAGKPVATVAFVNLTAKAP